MTSIEKIKVIANVYHANKTDTRSREEVFEHMIDWHSKGWLSKKFVDDCYSAIERGDRVEFSYAPNKYYNYLAGSAEAWKKVLK